MDGYTPTWFWYPAELRRVSSVPTGCAVGPLIFLSMLHPRLADGSPVRVLWDVPDEAVDEISTGVEHRDGREGQIRAGVWQLYQQVAEILESVGSSLGEIVRQRIVVSDPADIRPAEEVLVSLFADTDLPATVFNCEHPTGRNTGRTLGVEIVAFRAGHGADLSRVRIPLLEGLTDPYPQASRVGQLVFTSGIAGASGLDAPDGFGIPDTGHTLSDRTHLDLRSQLVECFGHLSTILGQEGADLHSGLRQTFFTNTDRQAWGFTSDDRRRLFPDPERFPTASAFGVPSILSDHDTTIMTDAIGLAEGEWTRQARVFQSVVMGHLPMCVTAGPFVFTTGYLAMDKANHVPVGGYSQLTGPERMLGPSRDGRDERVAAQAWHIYRQIVDILEEVGSGAGHVVQQTVFMTDVSGFASVEAVARAVFGDAFPATTLIGVESMGPYPGLEVEIEVIAVRDGSLEGVPA